MRDFGRRIASRPNSTHTGCTKGSRPVIIGHGRIYRTGTAANSTKASHLRHGLAPGSVGSLGWQPLPRSKRVHPRPAHPGFRRARRARSPTPMTATEKPARERPDGLDLRTTLPRAENPQRPKMRVLDDVVNVTALKAAAPPARHSPPLWDLEVLYPEHVAALVAAALRGGRPRALCNLLELVIRSVETADPSGLCLLCEADFANTTPAAFVLASAHVEVPLEGFGNALCEACAEPRETVLSRVAQAYDRAVPDFQILATPSEPGHA